MVAMMYRGTLVALLLGAVLGSPTAVGSQPASPVAITTCSVLAWQRGPTGFWNPYSYPLAGGQPITDGIRIAFVNRSARVADRVRFLVNYRGEVEHIIDAGTFSPHVTIDHTFGNFSGFAYLGPRPNVCRVVGVRFVDGTVWRGR
jgi:hypothetical protein